MSQTLSPSLARCYGMARVTRMWKISRASVYRSLKETPPNTIARRPGPVGACSDAELAEHIRQHIAVCFYRCSHAQGKSHPPRQRGDAAGASGVVVEKPHPARPQPNRG